VLILSVCNTVKSAPVVVLEEVPVKLLEIKTWVQMAGLEDVFFLILH
jgi:hypothetical protein